MYIISSFTISSIPIFLIFPFLIAIQFASLITDNFSIIFFALTSCITPIKLFTIITPANIAFLGEPAIITATARTRFKALNIVKKFDLKICKNVFDGAFGSLFTSPFKTLFCTSSSVNPCISSYSTLSSTLLHSII